jgi:hypothetical protein
MKRADPTSAPALVSMMPMRSVTSFSGCRSVWRMPSNRPSRATHVCSLCCAGKPATPLSESPCLRLSVCVYLVHITTDLSQAILPPQSVPTVRRFQHTVGANGRWGQCLTYDSCTCTAAAFKNRLDVVTYTQSSTKRPDSWGVNRSYVRNVTWLLENEGTKIWGRGASELSLRSINRAS